ncbi:unnamed protein product, partial [Meganyctiphanes norvegica]|uniref:Troponin I n=1 Tax=Meganyctiphanes norvegica TaxID=48144 RepID=A0AAV2S288_MEGNR
MGKKHKHFLSRERHKKLRMIIHHLVEEERLKEQEMKLQERRRIIAERVGQQTNIDDMDDDSLRELIKSYHERVYLCESQKWDLEFEVRKSDLMVHELYSQVNDLRGKFVKPALKKVTQYDKTMAKFQAKTGDFNFKAQLKHVAMG